MRVLKKDFVYLGIFFIVWALFFKDVLFRASTFCYRDIVRYYQPQHFFASENVIRGIMPYWNPYLSAGTPFLATLQHALFYPLSLLHYLFPFTVGFKFLFIIHYLFAGMGVYLLLRYFSLNAVSCLAGAIIFTFNGYLLSMLNLLTTLSAVPWISYGLLFFIAATKRSWLWAILAAFTLALEFYGGQPEVVYFSAIILAGYGFYLFLNRQAKLKKVIVAFLTVISVTVIISLPLILLSRELFNLSVREKGIDYRIVSYWSFHPLELVTTFINTFSWDFAGINNWFRQTWLRSFYFGLLPLFFVVLSFRSQSRAKQVKIFAWLGVIGLVLALGKYTPVHKWLFQFFPGFSLVRYAVKYIFILDFSLVILAAFGVEFYLKPQNRKEVTRFLSIFCAVVASVYVLFYILRYNYVSWLVNSYIPDLQPEKIASLYQTYLPNIFKESFKGLVILIGFVIFWWTGTKLKSGFLSAVCVLLIYANITFLQSVRDFEPLVKEEYYRDNPPVVSFLRENLGMNRYFFEKEIRRTLWLADLLGSKLPLLPNMGINYHFFDTGIYESIDLVKQENISRVLRTQPNYSCTPLARMLGMRYIFTQREIRDPYLSLVAKMKSFNVYENSLVLPRSLVVPTAIVKSGENELDMVNFLLTKEFDPSKMVLVRGDNSILRNLPAVAQKGNVVPTIIEYSINEVKLKVTAPEPSWLVLFDYYYPDWQASLNGQKTEIYEADYLFRAVRIPAGELQVRFFYQPLKFYYGIAIFLCGVTILSLFLTKKIKHVGVKLNGQE